MEPRPSSTGDPRDPIAAVTHRDPYPYYSRLVAEKPLYRDDALGFWVASSAAAVSAVLGSAICRVRPPREPVPAALQGKPAGELFGRLVRQNDGDRHAPLKRAVSAALGAVDGRRAAVASQDLARSLADELRPQDDPGRVQELAFRLPVHVVATLLGAGRDQLEPAARWTGEMAAGFAPGASPGEVERASRAAAGLRGLLQELPGDGLLADLFRQAESAGFGDREAIADNAAGFLLQSYEATAGLTGNTLLALARHPGTLERVRADPGHLGEVIQEVLRFDPPVQNTRRFLAAGGEVAGREMREGDAVLVVLAAASRDPEASGRPLFTFGAGGHACPGPSLAAIIARAGVEQALAAGVDPGPLAEGVSYRRSANVRIPLFSREPPG